MNLDQLNAILADVNKHTEGDGAFFDVYLRGGHAFYEQAVRLKRLHANEMIVILDRDGLPRTYVDADAITALQVCS